MEKFQIDKAEFNDKTIFVEEDVVCDTKCVYDWIHCVEDERDALICRTIKNNSYDDCKS